MDSHPKSRCEGKRTIEFLRDQTSHLRTGRSVAKNDGGHFLCDEILTLDQRIVVRSARVIFFGHGSLRGLRGKSFFPFEPYRALRRNFEARDAGPNRQGSAPAFPKMRRERGAELWLGSRHLTIGTEPVSLKAFSQCHSRAMKHHPKIALTY